MSFRCDGAFPAGRLLSVRSWGRDPGQGLHLHLAALVLPHGSLLQTRGRGQTEGPRVGGGVRGRGLRKGKGSQSTSWQLQKSHSIGNIISNIVLTMYGTRRELDIVNDRNV